MLEHAAYFANATRLQNTGLQDLQNTCFAGHTRLQQQTNFAFVQNADKILSQHISMSVGPMAAMQEGQHNAAIKFAAWPQAVAKLRQLRLPTSYLLQ